MLGHNKRVERKLRAGAGREAWATVLESKQEWASSGGLNKVAGQAGSFTIHQRLVLRVEPQDAEPFETTVKQVFNDTHGQHIPKEGWSVTVIYDPSDHSKLVIDLDKMFVRPGVDRDEARARHERALELTRDPELRAQRIEEMKAKAGAGASSDLVAMQQALAAKFLAQQSAAPGAVPDVADQLTKLANLRDRGVLTEAEFQVQKAKLLAGG